MTTPPATFRLGPETGAMLFVDCPFCLAPLPMDLAGGALDCPDCDVHLELAPDPVPAAALAAAATGAPALAAAA